MTIVKREGLGRPMTWGELDGNFDAVEALRTEAAQSVAQSGANANASAASAGVAETARDEALEAAAQVENDLVRVIKAPEGEVLGELPVTDDRRDTLLGFGSNGQPVVHPVSDFVQYDEDGNIPLPAEIQANTRELWRRTLADVGITLVSGSFQERATVQNANEAVWDIDGAQCYIWSGEFPHDAGSTPGAGWVSVELFRDNKEFTSVDGLLRVPSPSRYPDGEVFTVCRIVNGARLISKWVKGGTYDELTSLRSLDDDSVFFTLYINKKFYFEETPSFDPDNISQSLHTAFRISANHSAELNFANKYYEVLNVPLVGGMVINPRGVTFHSISGSCFISDDPEQIELTPVNGINEGSYTIELTETTASRVSVGDIIVTVSNNLITRRWTNNVVRDYYYDGEMSKVVLKVGNTIYLQDRLVFDIKNSELKQFFAFTPNKSFTWLSGGTIETSDVEAASRGMNVKFFDSPIIGDTTTRGFALAGIRINLTYAASIGKITPYGGSHARGLAYGLEISDSSRNCEAINVTGYGCRHSCSVTSTGLGCPVNFILHSWTHVSKYDAVENLHGPDCHAASAYCEFSNVHSDRSISFSGLGHKVSNVISTGGRAYLADDGGRDINFSNITFVNPTTAWNTVPMVNCTITSVTYRLKKPNPAFDYAPRFSGCNITYLAIINEFVETATDGVDAATSITVGRFIGMTSSASGNGNSYGTVYIYGFPGIRFQFGYVTIEKLILTDCAWNESAVSQQTGAVHWISEASSGCAVKEVRFEIKNTALLFNTRRGFYVGAGVKNARISDVSEGAAMGRSTSFRAEDGSSSVRVNNFQIPNFSNGQGVLYYTNVRGLADRTVDSL